MGRKKLPEKDFVWSPELAYAIGLIVTDGHLSSDGRHIVMRSSDIQLLETYKSCLNLQSCKVGTSKRSGYSSRNSYRVQHGDIQFYNWLISIGVPRRKTSDIGKIKIPDSFFPDFLRGHLDGDGSITTYIDTYNTRKNPEYVYERLWVRFLSASRPHLLWVQETAEETLGVKGHLNTRKPRGSRHVPMYNLKYGKKESLILLYALYPNDQVPCLHRKRDVAKKFI